MTELRDLFDVTKDGVMLHVHVQPGAGRSTIVGRHGAALKVRVAVPPVDGRANEASGALLAEAFGLPKSDVQLVSGGTSRLKRFRLTGLDVDDFVARLERAVGEGSAASGPRRRRR